MTVSPLPTRRGFALVELLAVLVIVGLLVGLLLPAVQRARDAGRLTQCANNLRQTGVALANYEQARRCFPPGNDQTGSRFHAWSSFILPYLEQADVAGRVDYAKAWNDAAGNLALSDVTIPTYVCPAGMKQFPGKQDYGGVLGSAIPYEDPAGPQADYRLPRGVGVLGELTATQRPSNAASVVDGLGKTLLVSEAVDREQIGADTLKSGDACWACGSNCFPLSSRVLNDPAVEWFRSLHWGGVQGLFGDGRVALLPDATDVRVLIALCTKAGGEPDSLHP
jgi:prepilin-type N-terminal cleavage/methylation domain-containing protein